jgi:hypothetical protein
MGYRVPGCYDMISFVDDEWDAGSAQRPQRIEAQILQPLISIHTRIVKKGEGAYAMLPLLWTETTVG